MSGKEWQTTEWRGEKNTFAPRQDEPVGSIGKEPLQVIETAKLRRRRTCAEAGEKEGRTLPPSGRGELPQAKAGRTRYCKDYVKGRRRTAVD